MPSLYMLRIEVDGHFHGSREVPRPWVARITGVDRKYGLARDFVKAMNDWEGAHRACSGNLYGVVATFPLRDRALYEVSRLRGTSSKRHVAREFVEIAGCKQVTRTPIEALAMAEGDAPDAPCVIANLDDAERGAVSEVTGLGTPRTLGFVVDDGQRLFRLRDGGVYEMREGERVWFATASNNKVATITHREALTLMVQRCA